MITTIASPKATAMPSTDTPTSKHETWEDWRKQIHPNFEESGIVEEYLTMAELIEQVNDILDENDATVDASTIRYWQQKRLLPSPIRRWHEGATRALYPKGAATHAIANIRYYQRLGHSLDEIRERIRNGVAALYDPNPHNLNPILIATARRREALTKTRVKTIELIFTDERGNQGRYTIENPTDG